MLFNTNLIGSALAARSVYCDVANTKAQQVRKLFFVFGQSDQPLI
ncbi:MAG: hypothetical protein OFPII_11270 [Osedax symbiont Rs1]|nr:MAG: hypothetical protein OFPII_11270 [Osedax symbiont Rs1]